MTCYCCGAEILAGDYYDGIGPLCEICLDGLEAEYEQEEGTDD